MFTEYYFSCLNFTVGCVKILGISNGLISDSQMKASTYKEGSVPSLGRLYRVPGGGEVYSTWRPADNDRHPYIEVDLGEESMITGIATQGHFDDKRREFATSYVTAYLVGSSWKYLKVNNMTVYLSKRSLIGSFS